MVESQCSPLMVEKQCSCCSRTLPLAMFYNNKGKPGGKASQCRSCHKKYYRDNHEKVREQQRKSRLKNAEKIRNYRKKYYLDNLEGIKERSRKTNLKHNYGLSAVDYEKMLESQGGVCAVCGKTCKTGRQLAVDHDHKTSKIRGLLCYRCNIGIGCFDGNAELIKVAITYLESCGPSRWV